ncbi:hypothetical protein HanPSC8_Chr14g0626331 [Helianthus annuus]|nr:hypothetical protein HanPSC8_Chr14g0626331 [Helianthus annuus]
MRLDLRGAGVDAIWDLMVLKRVEERDDEERETSKEGEWVRERRWEWRKGVMTWK